MSRKSPSLSALNSSIFWSTAIAVLVLGSSVARADSNWKVTSGYWSTSGNWNGGVPTSSSSAYISNKGTATINASGAKCSSLYLGNNSNEKGTLLLTAGSLTASYDEYIGNNSNTTGTFTQSAGSNTVSGTLYLGNNSNSTGYYTLSGTDSTLSATNEYVGNNGKGYFTQSAGSNAVSNTLYVGYNSSSTGSYALSGTGTLSASYEYIGLNSNSGSFTQSGSSTNTVANTLYLGYNSSGNGSYTLSGTASLSATDEYVGKDGKGTFTQYGGTNTVANSLTLGTNSSGRGTYNLDGGTLSIGAALTGNSKAAFNFGSGTLKVGSSAFSSCSMNMVLTGIDSTGTYTGAQSTVDTNGYNLVLSGILSNNKNNPAGLYKTGDGVLTLSNTKNTYTGDTTVHAGTLAVTGVITSDVTVESGATLTGTGTVGAVTIDAGGYFAPGTDGTIGTLTLTGNLDLTSVSDCSLLFDLSGSTSDLISMSDSTLLINGLDLSDFNFTAEDLTVGIYTLIDAASISGSLGSDLATIIDSLLVTLSTTTDGNLILSVSEIASAAVPEPGTMLIWGMGLMGLAFVQRRRAKQAI
jgi:autotransporter-associated beta strand protein/T5SS/PEP-CTERM-associated repeat protein